MRSRRPAASALAILTVSLAACGTRHSNPPPPPLPPAAEPAVSPQPAAKPAGRSISVGAFPEGIIVDPATGIVVVAVRNPARLVLLDAHTGRTERRVTTPAPPRHLELAPAIKAVLVPTEPVDALFELGLPGAKLTAIQVGTHPHAATAVGMRVFVGNEFGRSIWVIEGTRVRTRIGGFVQPGGIVTLPAAPGRQTEVAVVDVRANSLTLIDARTLGVIGRLQAGAGPTHAVADQSGRVYVADTRGGAILTYETRPTFRLVNRLPLAGAPYGIAIDPVRRRLWVTLTTTNELVELAENGGRLGRLRSYATGRQPNTVGVDPRTGRVFVADAGPGTVQLIDPRR